MSHIKSTSNQTAVIANQGNLFLIEHDQKRDIMHLKAVIFNKVKDLIKLEAGPNHFLAVKQTIRPKFE